MKSAGDSRVIKNMHNTTSGFYPGRFGDRVPTRGNVQSRGARQIVPSAQGVRRGNSRAENSLGRMQRQQLENVQQLARGGGTHYGNMFNGENLLMEPIDDTPNNAQGQIVITAN